MTNKLLHIIYLNSWENYLMETFQVRYGVAIYGIKLLPFFSDVENFLPFYENTSL